MYRQQHAGFYSTIAYSLAVNFVQLPLAILETIIFSSGVYWMTGFVDEGDRFLFFVFVLCIIAVSTAGMFRAISYAVPTMELGQVLIGPAIGILVIFCGIPITRTNIPPWFIWVYYLSPFSWSIRSLAINEYTGDAYKDIVANSTMTRGELYLDAYEFQSSDEWKWFGIVYLVCFLVILTTLGNYVLSLGKPDGSRGTSRVEENDDDNLALSYADMTDAEAEAAEEALANMHASAAKSMNGSTAITAAAASSGEDVVDVDTSVGSDGKAHALPFEPVSLVFKELCYDVFIKKDRKTKETKRLLDHVAGYARPGELTALMGVTGAGKTTLLDVLARRKTGGVTSGDILVNGKVPSKSRFARLVGYCEQNDLHEPFATVEEALQFSASLRLPANVPAEKQRAFVQEIMELIELDHLKDRLVGWPGQDAGLSQGQRKRLTLGVELVANTSILFLDEPTSGLDSREAEVVMRVVRNVARTGRTVVCTIHQPNADLFAMFDQLLLLARGGRAVFHGPLSQLQPYFESIEGVEAKPFHVNPATWMLDVIGASSAGSADAAALENGDGSDDEKKAKRGSKALSPGDFPRMYEESDLKQEVLGEIEKLVSQGSGSLVERGAAAGDNQEADEHAMARRSKGAQFGFVLRRAVVSYWRNVDYNLTRMVAVFMMGLIFGLLYLDVDTSDLAGVVSKMASIFTTAMFCGFINLLSSIPVIGE